MQVGGLSRNAVNCPSHPTVPWDHGITWDCPSYPTAPWDFPQDVHLSLYRCMCPTVHPIPQSHGIMGHSTECLPVPLIDTWISYCPSHPMGLWNRLRVIFVLVVFIVIILSWDRKMEWTVGVSVRGTCGHPMECPTVPWDRGMQWTMATVPWDRGMQWTIPLSHGTMGWDGQWDIHASIEGQVDIPWNVPLSHETVGWDGQFTAFLDIYGKWNNQHISISRPYRNIYTGNVVYINARRLSATSCWHWRWLGLFVFDPKYFQLLILLISMHKEEY